MAPIEVLNAWGAWWSAVALRSLVEGSALLVLVAIVWLAIRRRASPALGHGLFLLVLLKLVVPLPIAVPGAWASIWPQRLVERVAERAAGQTLEASVRSIERESRMSVGSATGAGQGPGVGVIREAALKAPESSASRTEAVGAGGRLSTAAVLMIAWAVVVAGLVSRLVWSEWRMRRLLARATALDPALLPVDVERLGRSLGLRRRVPLLVSPAMASPAVWGLVRPRLILPEGLVSQLAPGALSWILLHELAHIRRGDLWALTFQRLVRCLYFFHPAVWVAGRVLDVQREYACDDAALAAVGDVPRRDCGSAFLAVIEYAEATPGVALVALGMSSRAVHLRGRLLRILDVRRPVRKGMTRGASAVLVLLGLLVLPHVRATGTEGDPPSPPPAPAPAPPAAKDEAAVKVIAKPVSAPDPDLDNLMKTTVPITVRGRAVDAQGTPVVGATISLVSTNGIDAPLGTTTTDRDGRYTFAEAPLPVSRSQKDSPLAGTFQVYGTAPGFGFAWHGMRFYQLSPRQAGQNVARENHAFYKGDPLVMDLKFPPESMIKGRIVDGSGKPVAGAKLSLGNCDYLDTKGRENHLNFREFWCLYMIPDAIRATTTDQDGRFRFGGVPKEAGFWVHVTHPQYARVSLFTATTERPKGSYAYPREQTSYMKVTPPVLTGDLNLVMHATRRVAVRVVDAFDGQPVPKIRVSAVEGTNGTGANGVGAHGVSDAEGKLELKLPPGPYSILADPPRQGSHIIRTKTTMTVLDRPGEREQSYELRVNPGCVLTLEAVDADTGEGIPDVSFMVESDESPGIRNTLQVSTAYVEHSRTDASGKLRAVVEPGERTFSLGFIPAKLGYRQEDLVAKVKLPAGKPASVRFELHKRE